MKMMWTIALVGLVASANTAIATTSLTGGPDEQCNNYGNQVQFSVTGDNSYECNAQHCVGDGTAVATGAGVAWRRSATDPGVQASAGSNCSQGGNSTASLAPRLSPGW